MQVLLCPHVIKRSDGVAVCGWAVTRFRPHIYFLFFIKSPVKHLRMNQNIFYVLLDSYQEV